LIGDNANAPAATAEKRKRMPGKRNANGAVRRQFPAAQNGMPVVQHLIGRHNCAAL
jgi:hypothetical protein